ncbi:hypothetical protein AV530_003921 [Patagioenas fasciata monilis]|uniref:Uncharacterized protein n=1 Tax=Patagioenas fasciata monilis TaxID=372326 RepID=A0A1V4KZ20_PATFA|nr:hypothetical protein AV530_003921 [Patagioenas fasciata monilis]
MWSQHSSAAVTIHLRMPLAFDLNYRIIQEARTELWRMMARGRGSLPPYYSRLLRVLLSQKLMRFLGVWSWSAWGISLKNRENQRAFQDCSEAVNLCRSLLYAEESMMGYGCAASGHVYATASWLCLYQECVEQRGVRQPRYRAAVNLFWHRTLEQNLKGILFDSLIILKKKEPCWCSPRGGLTTLEAMKEDSH